jgi:hypothetical protein
MQQNLLLHLRKQAEEFLFPVVKQHVPSFSSPYQKYMVSQRKRQEQEVKRKVRGEQWAGNNEQRAMKAGLYNSQSDAKGGIYFLHFGKGERADEVSKQGFMNTDSGCLSSRIIAEYCTVVFKPFIDTNFNLGGEAAIVSVDRGANDRGKALIDKGLPGNNEKNPVSFGVIFRTPINTVQIAPFHGLSSSKIGIWYNSTSSASALSSSAWRRKSSISLSSDILSLTSKAGVKARTALPVGTSRGTSMINRRSAGISTVCVTVMERI